MKMANWSALVLVAVGGLSGCAQTANLAGNTADQQCSGLARMEDLRINEVMKVETAGDAQTVQMRLEDRLGRRFTATCAYTAANGARWSTPLPTNISRK